MFLQLILCLSARGEAQTLAKKVHGFTSNLRGRDILAFFTAIKYDARRADVESSDELNP